MNLWSRSLVQFLVLVFGLASFACSALNPSIGSTIKSAEAGNGLAVKINSADGVLRDGANTLTLVFENEERRPVEVGAVSLNFRMPAMGTMPEMNDAAVLTTTGTPGVYNAEVKLQMAGEWIAQIAYEGAAGKGKVAVPVTAQ